jgi:hypothetical protein
MRPPPPPKSIITGPKLTTYLPKGLFPPCGSKDKCPQQVASGCGHRERGKAYLHFDPLNEGSRERPPDPREHNPPQQRRDQSKSQSLGSQQRMEQQDVDHDRPE